MKIECGSLGATCTTVMSKASLRGSRTTPESATGNRLRSIPMTGVMPDPAVTKRNLPPSGGQHELAGRLLEVHQGAGAGVRTRWLLTLPSGTALTVMEM